MNIFMDLWINSARDWVMSSKWSGHVTTICPPSTTVKNYCTVGFVPHATAARTVFWCSQRPFDYLTGYVEQYGVPVKFSVTSRLAPFYEINIMYEFKGSLTSVKTWPVLESNILRADPIYGSIFCESGYNRSILWIQYFDWPNRLTSLFI